jgi:serine/threonine-protein kinase
MGEVYRADDLRLGQPVALKFLSATVEADPVRLAQFHNEVRLARQIAHKNVCRMYDIGETDGLPFMTMEYVDGEDLASLLRRIGRLPQDKALELAHQLCAGVAAAHERGVLHRDLKPANIMIDGAGQVRITDFGLAAIEGAADIAHAGTPAYMAPELLAGRDPSIASDIYALGLVLYEIFTGRRAYTAQNVRELIRQQNETTITSPATLVKDLDPAIDLAIARTLERDPADRPRSALEVAASLPGGDPLAAAIAAGQTPSPEMVAAAGHRAAATRTHAILATAAVIALLVIAAFVSLPRMSLSRIDLRKPPDVLVDRAHTVVETLGYGPPSSHSYWEFGGDDDLYREILEHPVTFAGLDVAAFRPGPLRFWWRSSPREMQPTDELGSMTMDDPPWDVSGMTLVGMDPQGRLLRFSALQPQVDDRPPVATPPDYAQLFKLAGLEMSQFHAVDPRWLPRGNSDQRAAWAGPMPDGPANVRVEAAYWRGRPIYFEVLMPWSKPRRMEESPVSLMSRVLSGTEAIATLGILLAAMIIARRNVKAGRGDVQAATSLAIAAVVGQMLAWLLVSPHLSEAPQEIGRLFAAAGDALFAAGGSFVMYLAAEPAMRHYWPDSLLGSTRLLRGRVIDARVGRDVLLGLAAGAVIMLVIWAREPIQFALGARYPVLSAGDTNLLSGPSRALASIAHRIGFQSMFASMWCVLGIVGLKRLLQRMWLVGLVATVALTFLLARDLFVDRPGSEWVNVASALLVVGLIVAIAIHAGLLAAAVALCATNLISAVPWTLDSGAWYFPQSALVLGVLAGLAAFGGYAMLSGGAAAPRRGAL